MPNVLIVGATRGLGAALATVYGSKPGTKVYGTTRSATGPATESLKHVIWVPHIDATSASVGDHLVHQLHQLGVGNSHVLEGAASFDIVIITAGIFAREDFKSLGEKEWDIEVKTYTTSAIAPPFIVHSLFHALLLPRNSKVLLVSSEAGSLTLRHHTEGGGNYAHHASKAALNMVGRLLAIDLREAGVIISIVHPGFMRTQMTKSVGFDEYWDAGGAVEPEVAAETLSEWVQGLDMEKSGEFWAPRGWDDIGTAEVTVGDGKGSLEKGKMVKLPW